VLDTPGSGGGKVVPVRCPETRQHAHRGLRDASFLAEFAERRRQLVARVTNLGSTFREIPVPPTVVEQQVLTTTGQPTEEHDANGLNQSGHKNSKVKMQKIK